MNSICMPRDTCTLSCSNLKAVVNEDASGDMLALQHQIRLLKVTSGEFKTDFIACNITLN
jgi:hypothetical protein